MAWYWIGSKLLYVLDSVDDLVLKCHIDGLVQERRDSSALAIEFRLSCTNPSVIASLDHWHKELTSHEGSVWPGICRADIWIEYQIQWKFRHYSLIHWPLGDAAVI